MCVCMPAREREIDSASYKRDLKLVKETKRLDNLEDNSNIGKYQKNTELRIAKWVRDIILCIIKVIYY